MKVVIDDKVYDSSKDLICLVLSKQDLKSLSDLNTESNISLYFETPDPENWKTLGGSKKVLNFLKSVPENI